MTTPDSHFNSVMETTEATKVQVCYGRTGGVSSYPVICPDCYTQLIRLGSCFSCPVCGFGTCG